MDSLPAVADGKRANSRASRPSDYFGFSVAISENLAVVGALRGGTGAFHAGIAYVINATTGALVATLNNPSPSGDDFFGLSVTISGNVVVVGASQVDTGGTNAGAAYVFDATTGRLTRTLSNPDLSAYDFFGGSVALSGNMAVVGSIGFGPYEGRIYLFDATSGVHVATLSNPTPWEYSYFGTSVAFSGNMAVVGANHNDAAVVAGTAFVFVVRTAALVARLNNPVPAPVDHFGHSIATTGNITVVGAYGNNTGEDGAGIAFVFGCSPSEHIRDHLLGFITDTTNDDLNGDGLIDIADLLMAGLQSP